MKEKIRGQGKTIMQFILWAHDNTIESLSSLEIQAHRDLPYRLLLIGGAHCELGSNCHALARRALSLCKKVFRTETVRI